MKHKLRFKGKLTAKTILLYVLYTALAVASGGVFGRGKGGLRGGAVIPADGLLRSRLTRSRYRLRIDRYSAIWAKDHIVCKFFPAIPTIHFDRSLKFY